MKNLQDHFLLLRERTPVIDDGSLESFVGRLAARPGSHVPALTGKENHSFFSGASEMALNIIGIAASAILLTVPIIMETSGSDEQGVLSESLEVVSRELPPAISTSVPASDPEEIVRSAADMTNHVGPVSKREAVPDSTSPYDHLDIRLTREELKNIGIVSDELGVRFYGVSESGSSDSSWCRNWPDDGPPDQRPAGVNGSLLVAKMIVGAPAFMSHWRGVREETTISQMIIKEMGERLQRGEIENSRMAYAMTATMEVRGARRVEEIREGSLLGIRVELDSAARYGVFSGVRMEGITHFTFWFEPSDSFIDALPARYRDEVRMVRDRSGVVIPENSPEKTTVEFLESCSPKIQRMYRKVFDEYEIDISWHMDRGIEME